MTNFDTDQHSLHLRNKAIDLDNRSILITNFLNSDQSKDLTQPPNCNGFGRIRHFRLDAGKEWIQNPLPILPAAKALGLEPDLQIRAQVFQNSVCNWRCWYCFVDYKLLKGDLKYSSFLTCNEMIDLYLEDANPPQVIDLTGGHPGLTPEWVPWMIEALKEKGLEDRVYLWSDDNLSNDYVWRFLSNEQIDLMSSHKMYSRVCCFKGIDADSFSLNTKADPKFYLNQFDLCKRLIEINLDLYFYVILTAKTITNFEVVIPKYLDSLQAIDEMLPLRFVPLRIFNYTPASSRMNKEFDDMHNGQLIAIEVWKKELLKRYSDEQLKLSITEIKLKKY